MDVFRERRTSMHPTNGSDDDVIAFQQALDLGHGTDHARAEPTRETEAARVASDKRAAKKLGRDAFGRKRPGERRPAAARSSA
jgi:hypothetical protein